MFETLTIDDLGKVTLPNEVQIRYGFKPNISVRVIETQSGVLLVPLTEEPMSETLKAKIKEWQELGAESPEPFPFKSEHEPGEVQGDQNLDDRAKLEVWLDALIAERRADKGEHERTMARVDRNLSTIKANLEIIRASREASCGKSSWK